MTRPRITSLPGESASDVARRTGCSLVTGRAAVRRASQLEPPSETVVRRTPTLHECADCECPTYPGEHTTDPITSARIRTAPCRRGQRAE